MNNEKKTGSSTTVSSNARQGVDNFENDNGKNKKEKVTTKDLKGKKVDAFPDTPEDQPLNQNKNQL